MQNFTIKDVRKNKQNKNLNFSCLTTPQICLTARGAVVLEKKNQKTKKKKKKKQLVFFKSFPNS